ncbi:MAG: hypothetical protein LUG19_12880, partial [Desulfovibrio sp.]|uniref:DpnI domain-containing protein n=1 Tax=Desulfovibrio sp. TaxID=885 RepID=UPI002586AD4F
MQLVFDPSLAEGYTSRCQKARRLSEGWIAAHMFCPCCGNPRLSHLADNKPVADFRCPVCRSVFELKSKNGPIGRKVPGGAYATMLARIAENTAPDFFFLSYSRNPSAVRDFFIIPKQFVTPGIIEKRRPLAGTARRAGWVGCNIMLSAIPEQGRIFVVRDGVPQDRNAVIGMLGRARGLENGGLSTRGWTLDVLRCVNAVISAEFSLARMYAFEGELKARHPDNRNIRAKIRQQLQLLRGAGDIS